MAIANFIPELWSAALLASLRKEHVFANLVNRNYEGEITNVGDTVHIQTPSAITTNNYAGTVTYETPTSTTQSLLIDQDKYWAFAVDDADKIQANINLLNAYITEGAYSMADAVDSSIAALYTDGTAGTVALDISTVYTGVRAALVDCGTNLDTNNVRSQARWLVVSPAVMKGIRMASDYTPASDMGDEFKRTGAVGFLEGFSIFMSTNVVVATQHKCMYGTNQAIAFAEQFLETEAIRLETAFKDAIRGRLVFGRKVVQPNALGVLNVTV